MQETDWHLEWHREMDAEHILHLQEGLTFP